MHVFVHLHITLFFRAFLCLRLRLFQESGIMADDQSAPRIKVFNLNGDAMWDFSADDIPAEMEPSITAEALWARTLRTTRLSKAGRCRYWSTRPWSGARHIKSCVCLPSVHAPWI